MSEACCTTFEKRARWLFSAARASGSPIPSYCPWCGKGVTSPAPLQRPIFNPLTSGRALLDTKNWPKGKPDCQLCRGQGFTMKRKGCCSLIPVPCPCTQNQVPGNPSNAGGKP